MKDLKMYINGKFVESRSGEWIEVLNPSTEEVTSRQPAGTVEDVNEAVEAAYVAQKKWAKVPAAERAVYLHKIADGIRANFDKFQEIIVREQGKTQALAGVEVGVTATYFDYMAEFARRIEGEVIQSDAPNETMILVKKPIGVAAGILRLPVALLLSSPLRLPLRTVRRFVKLFMRAVCPQVCSMW